MNTKIEKFEDLNVWKEGMLLTENIYNAFSNSKDFRLRDQIQRASVSIPSNIAEGFDRQTNKEFIQFLFIAKGSCSEVRTQIYIALKLKLVNEKVGNTLLEHTRKISAMLFKLIQTRKNNF